MEKYQVKGFIKQTAAAHDDDGSMSLGMYELMEWANGLSYSHAKKMYQRMYDSNKYAMVTMKKML